MSPRVSTPSPLISACSGLMYSRVPTIVPYCVNIVRHRQGLPFGLEASNHLPSVHARLDNLEGHLAPDRLGLFRHEDRAHAAFTDLLQELVGADDGAGMFANRRINGGGDVLGGRP